MSNNTAELKTGLAAKAGLPPPAAQPSRALSPIQEQAKNVQDWVNQLGPELERALPQHVKVDKLQRAWLTEIRRTPKLLECTRASLQNALMLSAQLGLLPGPMGHCYPVPFKNNAKNCTEVQFIIGYKGMINLSRRSGDLLTIRAMMVYSNDLFSLEYGNDIKMKHVPWYLRDDKTFTEGGQRRGAYMVATFKDGGYHIGYLSIPQIEANHRARSKAKNSGPWVTDYDDMCCKSVIRDNFKWLPYDTELMENMIKADADQPQTPETVPYTILEPEQLEGSPQAETDSAQADLGLAQAAALAQPETAAPTGTTGWEDVK